MLRPLAAQPLHGFAQGRRLFRRELRTGFAADGLEHFAQRVAVAQVRRVHREAVEYALERAGLVANAFEIEAPVLQELASLQLVEVFVREMRAGPARQRPVDQLFLHVVAHGAQRHARQLRELLCGVAIVVSHILTVTVSIWLSICDGIRLAIQLP